MPLFEYRCSHCDHQFEALVRDGNSPECPECHAKKPERLLSVVSARTAGTRSQSSTCPSSDAPPCGPGCCRLQ
jgi:putative FmdB family regulatory protein